MKFNGKLVTDLTAIPTVSELNIENNSENLLRMDSEIPSAKLFNSIELNDLTEDGITGLNAFVQCLSYLTGERYNYKSLDEKLIENNAVYPIDMLTAYNTYLTYGASLTYNYPTKDFSSEFIKNSKQRSNYKLIKPSEFTSDTDLSRIYWCYNLIRLNIPVICTIKVYDIEELNYSEGESLGLLPGILTEVKFFKGKTKIDNMFSFKFTILANEEYNKNQWLTPSRINSSELLALVPPEIIV